MISWKPPSFGDQSRWPVLFDSKSIQSDRRHARRRGFTLIELVVAATILCTLAVCIAPLVRWIGVERKLVEQRTIALSEVNSALERYRARGAALPAEPVEVPLAKESVAMFPHGQLTLAVVAGNEAAGGGEVPDGRWLAGTLRWTPFTAAKPMSVTQTVWILGGAK